MAGQSLSRRIDGLPVVADVSDRSAQFPSPDINQQVLNVGANAAQRWTGAAWVTSFLTGALGQSGWFNVRDPAYGATGDGTTDDTTAIQAALTAAAAASSGVVYFPSGAYKVTAPLTVGGFTTLMGTGQFGSIIYKTHTGDCFQVVGNFVHFRDMDIHGNVGVSTTYGTSGVAVNFNTNATGDGSTWLGGGIYDCDLMFRFATDAGHTFRCANTYLRQYTIAPGSEPNGIDVVGDTTAAFRQFSNLIFFAKVKLRGALDTLFTGCALRNFDTDAATSILVIQGCVLANNGNAQTLTGDNLLVQGCRIAGSVTLASGSNGCWVGNQFTSGAVTDSSGNVNNWQMFHRIEGTSLTTWIGPAKFRHGTDGIVHPESVQSAGDAPVSVTTTGTPTRHIIMFNTPLTANRAVTLNTGADYLNGDTYEIFRTSAATGASTVDVGAGPLKSLAVSQWCKVAYDGSTWRLMAFGSL